MRSRAPIFGVLAALLLGVAYYFLLYQPRNTELDEIRAETAQLETDRDTLQNELRRLQDIQAREVEFRASLSRLEEYIPSGIAQSTLIRQLQLAADQSGVEIVDVSFADPEPVEEALPTGVAGTVLGSIETSVSVDGGYFQMVDFLRRVEVDVTRAILVQTLSVVEGDDEFPELNTTWNGQLFALVPDTAETTPPEPAEGEEGSEDGDPDDGEPDDGEPDDGDLDDVEPIDPGDAS